MSAFVSIQDIVQLANLASDDILQRNKGRLLKYSKYVYEDMNLDVLRIAKREYFYINKKTNSINLPCNANEVASVNVVYNGIVYPVWLNQNLLGELSDVTAAKDCACEYNCGHQLCNTIKSYEATTETKSDYLPNGDPISFTCVDRKGVLGQMYYEETQYPLRVYESGVWVDTVLHTERKQLCEVEVDENGCVCDTEENINALCGTCGASNEISYGGTSETAPCDDATTWIYYCNSRLDWFSIQCGCAEICRNDFRNVYNISDSGNRLIFPANFGFDKVLIRYFQSQNTKDLQIPMIAVPTFILGLKWWDCRFNDTKQGLAKIYEGDYTKSKWGLFGELNRYRLAELRMISTPPTFVPSYVTPIFFTNYRDY